MSEMRFVFWDVQHGHATYLNTPNNRHIVVDLGTGSFKNRSEFSPLKHLRINYRVSFIDHVIFTHPHVDHIDDIFEFDNSNPKMITRPVHLDREPILRNASAADRPKLIKYFEISDRYNNPVGESEVSLPQNWGGMLYSTFTTTTPSQSNINNHSVVTIFVFNGMKVLVPGDNEPPSWNELKVNQEYMRLSSDVDILLAPHHGRASGYDDEMMKHINPRITVISDGPFGDSSATNRYSQISRGWDIHKGNGTMEKRYCLTTRSDGVIVASLGVQDNGTNYIAIRID